MRPMIDAHLDLAWNALYFNRDLLANVAEVRESEREITDKLSRGRNMVTFPELRRAKVAVCIATLLGRSGPDKPKSPQLKRVHLDYATQAVTYSQRPTRLLSFARIARASAFHHHPRRVENTLGRLGKISRGHDAITLLLINRLSGNAKIGARANDELPE